MQKLIINDDEKERLKKFRIKMADKLKNQIKQKILQENQEKAKKQKEAEKQEDRTPNVKSHTLEHLVVPQSELQPIRKLQEESGNNINEETLQFVKMVEDKAYPETMNLVQDVKDIKNLEEIYGYNLENLVIARNRDWYIVYGENKQSIEIVDIASLPTRDRVATQEIHNYITKVINTKAHNAQKKVILNAKEDTSYKMIQRMVKNGEYKIEEDIPNIWEDDSEIKMHFLTLTPIIQRELDEIE